MVPKSPAAATRTIPCWDRRDPTVTAAACTRQPQAASSAQWQVCRFEPSYHVALIGPQGGSGAAPRPPGAGAAGPRGGLRLPPGPTRQCTRHLLRGGLPWDAPRRGPHARTGPKTALQTARGPLKAREQYPWTMTNFERPAGNVHKGVEARCHKPGLGRGRFKASSHRAGFGAVALQSGVR